MNERDYGWYTPMLLKKKSTKVPLIFSFLILILAWWHTRYIGDCCNQLIQIINHKSLKVCTYFPYTCIHTRTVTLVHMPHGDHFNNRALLPRTRPTNERIEVSVRDRRFCGRTKRELELFIRLLINSNVTIYSSNSIQIIFFSLAE